MAIYYKPIAIYYNFHGHLLQLPLSSTTTPVYNSPLSTITTAIAISRLCVSESCVDTTPIARARAIARPLHTMPGLPPRSFRTSISVHRTPRLIPVPKAFAPASFAANRAAKLSAAPCTFLRQYAISNGVNTRSRNRSPNRSTLRRIRAISIKSVPKPRITGNPPRAAYPIHFAASPPLAWPSPIPLAMLRKRCKN